MINEEKEANEAAKKQSGTGKIGWTSYASFAEIESFVKELPSINSIASVQSIGKSTEGRDIYAVKVSTSPNNRKAIFIDASMYFKNITWKVYKKKLDSSYVILNF